MRFVLFGGVLVCAMRMRHELQASRCSLMSWTFLYVLVRSDLIQVLTTQLAHVEFFVNASFPEILAYLRRASIGWSTMVDERFDINVIEFLVSLCSFSHASSCSYYRSSRLLM